MNVDTISRAASPADGRPDAGTAVSQSSRRPQAVPASVFDSINSAKLDGAMNRAHGVPTWKKPLDEKLVSAARSLADAKVDIEGKKVSAATKKQHEVKEAANRPDIQKVATDFSSLLVQQLVREMFETVKEGEGPFGEGPGNDISRGIAETSFSQSLAESGMASLKDAIARAIGEHAPPAADTPTAPAPSDFAPLVTPQISTKETSR